MSTRIPPSLSWLIDKRARLDAEIKKTEKSLIKAKGLIEELSNLKENLAAVDKTLSLHDIPIDINLIKPMRSQYIRIKLPHGELTRSILLCLRLNQGDHLVTTSEIAAFIVARNADLAAQPEHRSQLSLSLHNRLKGLAREGVIQRHHPLFTNADGLWSLAPSGE